MKGEGKVCDCYSSRCEFCNNMVEIHIADYSTERKNVKVVCHECHENGEELSSPWFPVSIDHISRAEQVWCEYGGDVFDIGEIGKPVQFYTIDKNAYGVHLN